MGAYANPDMVDQMLLEQADEEFNHRYQDDLLLIENYLRESVLSDPAAAFWLMVQLAALIKQTRESFERLYGSK